MEVTLAQAYYPEKPILHRLMELYLFEFSRYTLDDIGPDGLYGYYYFDRYWTEPTRRPFLIRVGPKLAGFVLVRLEAESLLDPKNRANHIAEFFVLPNYRHKGVGTQAAFLAFDLFRGKWEVAQIPENALAVTFWRHVIAAYTGGRYVHYELDNERWQGTLQTFDNG